MDFYLKFAVCDEDGNDVVRYPLIRLSTMRYFYNSRLLPANVANTYESFAKFMSWASWGVNVIDLFTTFSRSNYKKPTTLRVEVVSGVQNLATVLTYQEEEKHGLE